MTGYLTEKKDPQPWPWPLNSSIPRRRGQNLNRSKQVASIETEFHPLFGGQGGGGTGGVVQMEKTKSPPPLMKKPAGGPKLPPPRPAANGKKGVPPPSSKPPPVAGKVGVATPPLAGKGEQRVFSADGVKRMCQTPRVAMLQTATPGCTHCELPSLVTPHRQLFSH